MFRPPASLYAEPRRRVSSLVMAGFAAALVTACSHPRAGAIRQVIERYDEMAARVDWPGFDPPTIPVALYDEDGAVLLRHPSPPEGFSRLRGVDEAWVSDSVPASMRANTSIDLDGVRTAVIAVPTDGEWDVDGLAARLIHEAFHAYQVDHHPGWAANEADLFTYPYRSASLLEMRRREGGALRRALTARDSVRELCWAQGFLRERERRFRRLPAEARAYERGTEAAEGLARYVESQASGREDPELPADGFPPEDIRSRSYATGHALALLLDRLAPGWKRGIEADSIVSLDGRLAAAIGDRVVRTCRAAPDEAARTRNVARADSADLAAREARLLAAFEQAAGWGIEVVSEASPLFPAGFDPLNVRVLDDRRILHTRWVRLSNGVAGVEVLGRTALTRGRPGHPLFAGIERFRVTGLPEPRVDTAGDTLRVRGEGVDVEVVGGRLERDGRTLRIVVPRVDGGGG